jgi:hypothetical protein
MRPEMATTMGDPSLGTRPERATLARLLGEAVGHVVWAIRTPVGRVRVNRRTATAEVGDLRLHRTVIDEVERIGGGHRSPSADRPPSAASSRPLRRSHDHAS